MAENYSYGTLPARTNTKRVLEVKMLTTLNGGGTSGGGSGSTFGAITQGSGAPVAAPANPAVSALYTDTSDGTLYYWNIASQAWL